MSDKSYQIKENNQVMIQGGEKKVMKKILSVALSTAMAFSMFASVAFGDDALNTQQKFDVLKEKGIFTGYPDGTAGLDKDMTRAEFAKVLVGIMGLEPIEGKASFKDKNYKADKWPAPYVEAVYAAGLMEGKNTTKMIFDFNGKITVQEMAKVLVLAQKIDIPTETNNNASDWAKGYVQAAINSGLVDAKANPKANASRSQLVDVAYSIYLAQQKPKVASYKVSENGKVVEFTLANSEVVKVTLETALVPNKDTEVKFTHNNYEYTETVKWVVTEASKVQGVAADNLKEVVVTFDGEVDKATAELKDNYKISGAVNVKSAKLNDAKNAVTLTVENQLNNQQKYNLTVSGVKAGTKTISAKDIEFAPVDNKLPEVVSVTGLGTKAVKIVFSEPVKQTLTGSFQLDGKGFYGEPKVEGREWVVKSAETLSVGEHTLTVSGVEDFAGFKSLKSEHKFSVVEDTTAPTIQEATATLEKLTVTFSEDIDPDTLSTSNVYHLRGASKINPESFTAVAGNKYEFYFKKENALPTYATTIFVEGVKDYSGNQISETSKQVTAQIDTERPTVVDARVDAADKKRLVVTFNKPINPDQNFESLVTVKDKDGKVQPIRTASVSDNNKLLVDFYSALPEGASTVEIKGIKDNTVLGNVMQDYSTTVSVGDTTRPEFAGASFNITDSVRRAVVVFNEKMDAESLLNRANYQLTINGDPTPLPNNAQLTVIQDSKAVVIELPSEIGSTVIDNVSWSHLTVTGVKDASGNYLTPLSYPIEIRLFNTLEVKSTYNDTYQGSLTGKKEIKVKLNQAVSGTVNKNTVKVNGAVVKDVVTNNNDVVTITLNDDHYDTTGLTVEFAGTTFNGVSGNRLTLGTTTTPVVANNFDDEVKPEVASGQNVYATQGTATSSTYTAKIYVTEDLKDNAGLVELYPADLEVKRLSDRKVVPAFTGTGTQPNFSYTVRPVAATATEAAHLLVTIEDNSGSKELYTIEVKSGARYIQDQAGNVIAAKGPIKTN
ncbi:Ig-like domain-containing protein [Paenibacillus glucanolyticus]